jgi:hypothetical protein
LARLRKFTSIIHLARLRKFTSIIHSFEGLLG